MAPRITDLDHFILTVGYRSDGELLWRVLGTRAFTVAGGTRTALRFGEHKITDTPIDDVVAHLTALGVELEHRPHAADGARRSLRSIWLRDPDGNLIELANETAG